MTINSLHCVFCDFQPWIIYFRFADLASWELFKVLRLLQFTGFDRRTSCFSLFVDPRKCLETCYWNGNSDLRTTICCRSQSFYSFASYGLKFIWELLDLANSRELCSSCLVDHLVSYPNFDLLFVSNIYIDLASFYFKYLNFWI